MCIRDSPTTVHTAARLLQEQLGMCYGPDAVEHIVTSHVDKMGIVTQFFVMSLPLSILRQQYRTGLDAQRAVDAVAASHDLATNPRSLRHAMNVSSIMKDTQGMSLSLSVVAMAIKAAAERARARLPSEQARALLIAYRWNK